MKKSIAIVLALLLLFSLVSCFGDDNKPADTTDNTVDDNGNEAGSNASDRPAWMGTTPDTSDEQKDDKEGQGWPTQKIATLASTVGATVPEIPSDSVTYSMIGNDWLTITAQNVTREARDAFFADLAQQGFIRSITNTAFKLDGLNRFNVSIMLADGEATISMTTSTLKETEWPYYRLRAAFGENFGIAVFQVGGAFSGLEKTYEWTYDAATATVVCNEADDALEEHVRDQALTASDYFDDEKYVKYMFVMTMDEEATEGKQMECYVTREGEKLTVRFVLADRPSDD